MVTSGIGKGQAVDRRVLRTRATLQAALIELVAEQDLPRISVADVAERAGVSRSTFYDHYQDVHQLAETACTAMIDTLIASIPAPADVFDRPGVIEALRAFFAAFGEHANLYRSLLGPQGSARVMDYIRRRVTAGIYASTRPARPGHAGDTAAAMDRTVIMDGPHDTLAAFTAGALLGVAVDWLQLGAPVAPAELAVRTWPMFTAVYGTGDGPVPAESDDDPGATPKNADGRRARAAPKF